MSHSVQTTAVLTAHEPANGTVLVLDRSQGDYRVIWRDDAAADVWYDGEADGQVWFNDPDEDPMVLHQHLKYADAVYALGEKLADFR